MSLYITNYIVWYLFRFKTSIFFRHLSATLQKQGIPHDRFFQQTAAFITSPSSPLPLKDFTPQEIVPWPGKRMKKGWVLTCDFRLEGVEHPWPAILIWCSPRYQACHFQYEETQLAEANTIYGFDALQAPIVAGGRKTHKQETFQPCQDVPRCARCLSMLV